MFNKTIAILCGCVSVCMNSLFASPLVTIGESTHIYFTGRTSMHYDSNIFQVSGSSLLNKDDDFIYKVQPGLQLAIGGQSSFKLTLDLAEELVFYSDHSELNQANEIARLNAEYDGGGQTTFKLNGGYRSQAQNTPDQALGTNGLGALVRTRNYDLGFGATYKPTGKMEIATGLSWAREDYRSLTNSFVDNDTYTAPLDLFYLYSEKLKFGVGYRFRHVSLEPEKAANVTRAGARDRNSHFFSLRLVGELAPKLTNDTSLGWQFERLNGLQTNDTMTVNTQFTWEATQKIGVNWGINRDFSASGTGSSIERTGGNLGVSYAMTDKIRSAMGLGYSVSDYKTQNREDDLFNYYWNWTYILNKYFQFDLGYVYMNNDSSVPLGGYNRHQVNLSANVKY